MSYYRGPASREWQKEAISHWSNYNKGIIQAVPGSGKTILAIETFCQKLDEDPNVKVLIVCPRLTLIKQWTNEILENTILKEKIFMKFLQKRGCCFQKLKGNFLNIKYLFQLLIKLNNFFLKRGGRIILGF